MQKNIEENSVAKGQLNHVHCEPSFTEAELQSLHPRVPVQTPIPPEVALCVAQKGVRVKLRTAARQPLATLSKLFIPVSK